MPTSRSAALRPALGRAEQAASDENVHPRADHKGSVDASLQAREGGASFGNEPGAPAARILEAEAQQVGGEAVATGEGELARRLGALDVKARERGSFRKRAWPRKLGVFTGEQPRWPTAAGGGDVNRLTTTPAMVDTAKPHTIGSNPSDQRS